MPYNTPSNKPQNDGSSFNQSIQMALIVLGVLGLLYFFFTYIWYYLIRVLLVLALIVLVFNYKIVFWYIEQIKNLWRTNQNLGILAVIASIVLSPLVIIVLAGKTLLNPRK